MLKIKKKIHQTFRETKAKFFLLSYNFAFKELYNCTVCTPPSLITRETAYQPTIPGKRFLKKLFTMFPILHYEYDWNVVCHKIL